MYEERLKVLKEMGFFTGNLAFDRLDKRAVIIKSEPSNPGKVYSPRIRINDLAEDATEQEVLVSNLFTMEMIPDILDNLRIQMGEKKTITSERLIEEIRETNHEVSLLVKSFLRQRKDELCLTLQSKQ